MSVPILDAWLFWNTIKVQELKLLAWNKIKLLTWQGSMYSLKSTAMLRCFITMLHGKVFTWFHNLLLATKKKNILIAWCCICGATSTFLLSLHKAWRVYKDWLHVIASVNLCKLTSPPHTPFHNLFSLYINTMESCCLCLEKQKRMVRKPEPLSRRHSSPPSSFDG